MEKEISSGTMLGIVLIALAAVIGLGFGVFSIAKGVANEGTVGVQDNLEAVSGSAFEDYNDKIVTGTMVKSAVQNFTGKSVAIFVNTNAMDKSVKSYDSHAFLSVWGKATDATTNLPTFTASTCMTANGDKLESTTTHGMAVTVKDKDAFVNYNALLNAEGMTQFNMKDGVYTTDAAFLLTSGGKVAFDNTVGGFTRTGNCEYLSPSAKFNANLIKDTSGTTIGIVFEQQAR